MFSHYSSFIPLVLVLFVWGTFVTLCVTVTNIYISVFTKDVVYRILSCNCVFLSTNKGSQINLFSHGPNNEFLVLDSCRVTERNGNSIISADATDDTIENDKDDACFSCFQTIWQLFWTFRYCRITQYT
jgi:hypothetical protein